MILWFLHGRAGAWAGEGVRVVWDNAGLLALTRQGSCISQGDGRQILIFRMTLFWKPGRCLNTNCYLVDYHHQERCKMVFILCEELCSWPESLQSLSCCQIGRFSFVNFTFIPSVGQSLQRTLSVVHFSDLSWAKADVEVGQGWCFFPP